MHFIYLHPVNPQSRKANIVQTLSMCSAISNHEKKIKIYYSNIFHEKTRNDFDIPLDKVEFGKIKLSSFIDSDILIFKIFGTIIMGLFLKVKYFLANKNDIIFITRDPLLAYLIYNKKNKLLFEEHAFVNNILYKKIRSFLYRKENVQILYISESLKKLYENIGFISSNSLVYHDAAFYKQKPKIIHNKKIKNIGHFGSLGKGRGIDIILHLAKKFKNINFNIYGKVEDKYIEIIEPISNIKNYGIIPNNKVRDCMIKNDLLLMPYEKKSLKNNLKSFLWMSPMKMFEYMESGVPIIASDIHVLKEVISEKTSFLANPDDLKSWEIALIEAKNKIERESRSKSARELIKLKYNWSKRAKFIINSI